MNPDNGSPTTANSNNNC